MNFGKPPRRVPMWAHPDFRKELKIASVEQGKHMEDITKDLAMMLKEERAKKIRLNDRNGFI